MDFFKRFSKHEYYIAGLLVVIFFMFFMLTREINGPNFNYGKDFINRVTGACTIRRPKAYLQELIEGDTVDYDLCPDILVKEPSSIKAFKDKVLLPYLNQLLTTYPVIFTKTKDDGNPDVVIFGQKGSISLWVRGAPLPEPTELESFRIKRLVSLGDLAIKVNPGNWDKVRTVLEEFDGGIVYGPEEGQKKHKILKHHK